ncbi:hypothetical protein [Arthrobacter sp. B0490]|uniref:hypothetical protein n=1 Tax=Arthrobacter sp. B0490 TaxID=2058891 RepID=UPI000CE5626D|nr:hypothetical protein [Arthrobacter sp. B0490]
MEAAGETASRPVDRALPIVGSAGVGLLSLGLGTAVHALSGGVLPSVPILCGLAALAVLAATLVARARLPGWAVLLLLGAAQQVLHWLFGGLGAAPSSTVPATGVHHGGEVPVGSGAGQGHSPEVMLMLHTHLAVALLVALAVAQYPSLRGRLSRRGPGAAAPQRDETHEGAPVA